MNFPTDLKYTKDHEWIRVDGDAAYVGITDYAQSELGEIVYVDITSQGENIAKETDFSTVSLRMQTVFEKPSHFRRSAACTRRS